MEFFSILLIKRDRQPGTGPDWRINYVTAYSNTCTGRAQVCGICLFVAYNTTRFGPAGPSFFRVPPLAVAPAMRWRPLTHLVPYPNGFAPRPNIWAKQQTTISRVQVHFTFPCPSCTVPEDNISRDPAFLAHGVCAHPCSGQGVGGRKSL